MTIVCKPVSLQVVLTLISSSSPRLILQRTDTVPAALQHGAPQQDNLGAWCLPSLPRSRHPLPSPCSTCTSPRSEGGGAGGLRPKRGAPHSISGGSPSVQTRGWGHQGRKLTRHLAWDQGRPQAQGSSRPMHHRPRAVQPMLAAQAASLSFRRGGGQGGKHHSGNTRVCHLSPERRVGAGSMID